jgi:hypothetical protein
MTLKDWKKRGKDWYQYTKGKGELWVEEEPYEEVHRINARIVKTVRKIRYRVYVSYPFDAGHPDSHYFKTYATAHNYIMGMMKS